MVLRYILHYEKNDIPEGAVLLPYGTLFEREEEHYAHGIDYFHDKCVGAFVLKDKEGVVNLITSVDWGKTVRCVFIPRDRERVFYLSPYDKNPVVDRIMIVTNPETHALIGTIVEREEEN